MAPRYGILSSGYKLVSFYAAHAQDSFEDARQVEHEMTSWMRKRWEMRKNKECNAEIGEPSEGNTLFGVSDPPVVKTKGKPGKKSTAQDSRNPRKCSNCKCRVKASNDHLPMTPGKRKIPDSTHPPLCRSKRLALCKDVAISVDQSTDGGGGGGDEENNVNYSGDSWPPEDTEDNPNPKILLNILKKDFVLLHHIFWWNVHPKSPRRAVYNGFKPDIPSMWWDSIYDAWTNDHPAASLPLGHLLTGFIHHRRKIPYLIQDRWGKLQNSVIGPGTIGKSEGQSKLHREVNNPASLEGLRDMILTVQEN
ncbi:hypothetical protein RHGRI_005131 [Rhododendron griersonianum]|uniref:Uncharacterized protein n=1 Tax=Rhododendron griersonianum TaxID=479676 RepID=A0AAV6LBI0_9ERIC|nr:hypothetical protein RHGRI_005131 [Rhododendron griersonianum]